MGSRLGADGRPAWRCSVGRIFSFTSTADSKAYLHSTQQPWRFARPCQLHLQRNIDPSVIHRLFTMANDQNFMSLFPGISACPQNSANDPDVLFDLDEMAHLCEDSFRRDSHCDSISHNDGKNGTATGHLVHGRTKLMCTAFGAAGLHASKDTAMLDCPNSSKMGQPLQSSPLMPPTMWPQSWNNDFPLFDETVLTQRGLPWFENSNAANGFDTFLWPEPDTLLGTSTVELPYEPSQDGISPLSKMCASGMITDKGDADTDHGAGVTVDKAGRQANKRKRTDSSASSKRATEEDSAGGRGVEVRRRAKNRLAANKSRAKSKRHHEILQERYEQSLEENCALKRQEQALRESAAFLKDCLLQHNSSSCSCKCLHQFNKLRAESIARGIISPGGRLAA
jgi:hypothetical protein